MTEINNEKELYNAVRGIVQKHAKDLTNSISKHFDDKQSSVEYIDAMMHFFLGMLVQDLIPDTKHITKDMMDMAEDKIKISCEFMIIYLSKQSSVVLASVLGSMILMSLEHLKDKEKMMKNLNVMFVQIKEKIDDMTFEGNDGN